MSYIAALFTSKKFRFDMFVSLVCGQLLPVKSAVLTNGTFQQFSVWEFGTGCFIRIIIW